MTPITKKIMNRYSFIILVMVLVGLAIVIKAGADCEFVRGDIVKACINKKQIYVFDKENELNIKYKI